MKTYSPEKIIETFTLRHFPEGWEAEVKILYDSTMISEKQINELMKIAGTQIGIGKGRNGSRSQPSFGYGCFKPI